MTETEALLDDSECINLSVIVFLMVACPEEEVWYVQNKFKEQFSQLPAYSDAEQEAGKEFMEK